MDVMTSHTWNIVVFALDGIILLGIIVHLFRAAFFCGLFSRMRSKLKTVAVVLRSWRTEPETDELEVRLKERINEGKLLSFRRLCQGSCVLFTTPLTIKVMLTIATGQLRFLTPIQDALCVLFEGILLVILYRPDVISWKTMDPLYIIFSVMFAVQTAPFACKPEFMIGSVIIANTFVCIGSIVRRSLIVTTSMNLIVGLSSLTSIWVYRDFGSQPPRVAMTIQLLSCMGIACISCWFERSVKAMIRQRMEVEATREVLAAAVGLLRSCCDVVVELNTEGVIVSPGTDLGSFLLRGTDRCMQGCCLAELMPHEDERCNFLDKLDGPVQSSTGLAEVMHVHMRDGLGNDLQLELLLVRFHRCCDRPHYMVGLREFGDLAVCHRLQNRQAIIVPSMAQDADGVGNEEAPNMAVSSSESIDSREEFDAMSQQHHQSATLATFTSQDADTLVSEESLGVPASSESKSIDSREEPSAVAVLDCSQPGFPIRSVSPGFGMRIGRVELNSSMTDMVKQKDNFVVWLETALIAQAHNLQDPPDCRVVLKMPQGRLKARCRLLPSEAGSGGYERVQLLFYGVAGRHERRERRQGAGQQEGGSLRGTPVSHMVL